MPRPRSRVRLVPAPGAAPTRAVPAVDAWTAAEMFVSPHVEERRRGFALLCGPEETRRSPLAAYLLATRLTEPDLDLRAQVVLALAEYFAVRGREFRYPPELRAAVANHLRQYDRPEVLALLELHHASRVGDLSLPGEALIHLLERIPGMADALVRLAGERSLLMELRQAAVEVVGLVGFVAARPALEGLQLRIAGRRAGQLTMLFAPSDWPEDEALLPALAETLRLLGEVD